MIKGFKKQQLLAVGTGLALSIPAYGSVALADCPTGATAKQSVQCGVNASDPNSGSGDLTANFRTIANTLLIIIGAVSVIVLIIGGFRYVLSNGNSSSVSSAKDTILYAIIGLVVALLAGAIVNFVVGKF